MNRHRLLVLAGAAMVSLACSSGPRSAAVSQARVDSVSCDSANGGIMLSAGFCAAVVTDLGIRARHLAVAPNGDIFVATVGTRDTPGGVIGLRDTNGDGRADTTFRFGTANGSGIALRPGFLWFATNDAVMRFPIAAGSLQPSGPPDTIVSGLPADRNHTAKTIAVTADGKLFVNIGSPTNSCQQRDRTAGSLGQDPCPDLETRAGVWQFDANRRGQVQGDGRRFATGIRNAVAITLHPATSTPWVMQHGRDQLNMNWPQLFTPEQSAELPAEEMFRLTDGADFGWPYCYYDHLQQKKVLAPEYGGDGRMTERCDRAARPVVAFPGHWAPNALLFYDAAAFPARYRGGAFIAFHGSWNRDPLPQGGYKVMFVPFEGETPAGEPEVFADGFAGAVVQPRGATHRPTGLAIGPDGSLYVSDTQKGRIWRIIYRGS